VLLHGGAVKGGKGVMRSWELIALGRVRVANAWTVEVPEDMYYMWKTVST
jgi:hypothetical protein